MQATSLTPVWQQVDRNPDRHLIHIGPVAVDNALRKYKYLPHKGDFRWVVQDFRVPKKAQKVVDHGFRDKHIQKIGTRAYHSSGSPVFTHSEATAIYQQAVDSRSTLAEALLSFCQDNGIEYQPGFAREVEAGRPTVPHEIFDEYGVAPEADPEAPAVSPEPVASVPKTKRKVRRKATVPD